MFKRISAGILILSVFSLAARADTAADVKAAAQKLGESANYSWKTSSTGGQRTTSTTGKTEKDGYTTLSVSAGDTNYAVVIKGEQAALQLPEGWKTIAEAAGGDQQPNAGRFLARMVQNFKSPATVAGEMADKAKELTKADDAISGDLTEEGAKTLMSFGRRGGQNANAPTISNAKGTVKFWIKDGVLSKYEFNVQGTMTFNGQDRDVNRTTTVEISDIGSTKIEVPAEAQGKLAPAK